MPEEIWKAIAGYEGLYEVSSLGNVKSLISDKLLSFNISRGYYIVHLYKSGVSKAISVHRLVATAFIPNPENKPEVDHIDTDASNNAVPNLRWVTKKENQGNPLSRKHHSEVRKGIVFSPETLKKMSEAQKGPKSHMFGKHLSEEHKQKLIAANTGRHPSPEDRKRMSEREKGEKHWNYGLHLSEDTKRKIGLANSRAVLQCDEVGNVLREWSGSGEIERELGVCSSYVTMCCRGKVKKAKGYYFRYKD